MSTAQWLPVTLGARKAVRPLEDDSVEVQVFVSPHDVPEAVRGFYDVKLRRFVIEFRYIGEEHIERQVINDQLVARIGKHSGRLYGVEVNVDRLSTNSVSLVVCVSSLVDHELERLSREGSIKRARSNYRLARRAIGQQAVNLFRPLRDSSKQGFSA